MSSKKTASFINRNIIAIVIIPTIFALHWACNSIQNNEKFVKQHERKDLPIIMVSKNYINYRKYAIKC